MLTQMLTIAGGILLALVAFYVLGWLFVGGFLALLEIIGREKRSSEPIRSKGKPDYDRARGPAHR